MLVNCLMLVVSQFRSRTVGTKMSKSREFSSANVILNKMKVYLPNKKQRTSKTMWFRMEEIIIFDRTNLS